MKLAGHLHPKRKTNVSNDEFSGAIDLLVSGRVQGYTAIGGGFKSIYNMIQMGGNYQ